MVHFRTQFGQSMVEFVIVLPVLLILIFGALQFGFIYHAKTTLNYATFMAARAGSVSNGHLGIMENALARGLAPLYTHCDEVDEVKRARDRVQNEIAAGFGRIVIINPSTTTNSPFADFNPAGSPITDRYIPNDNLMYRSPTLGGTSGLSIQDANVLKIRASYCYPMYVPYVDQLIAKLLTQLPDADCPECLGTIPDGSATFEEGCLDNDRFPINAQAIIRMQSPAYENAMTSGRYPGPAGENTPFGFVASSCP